MQTFTSKIIEAFEKSIFQEFKFLNFYHHHILRFFGAIFKNVFEKRIGLDGICV